MKFLVSLPPFLLAAYLLAHVVIWAQRGFVVFSQVAGL